MSSPCVSCGLHHVAGEAIRGQDHELPVQDMDGRPGDGRSLEQMAAEWQAQVDAERAAAR